MNRVTSLCIVLLLLLAGLSAVHASFFFRGGVPASAPTVFASVTLSNTSFNGGSPSGTVIGALTSSLSFGPFIGSYSIRITGVDNAGVSCTAAGNNFTVTAGSLVTVGTVAAGSYAGVCVVATQAMVQNSPYVQAFTIVGISPVTITGVSISNTSFAGGAASGTVVGALSTTLSSGSFTGSYAIRTTGTDHAGTTCTTTGNNFTISGSNLVTNGVVAAGSYTGVCVVASQSGLTSFVQAMPTLTGTSGTIACDIGPPYNGTVPAGAAAAGFTHCAANYDFTSTTNFIYNGNTYNYSQVTSWLGLCGGSNPGLWFNTGYNSPPTSCNEFTIVSDGGSNALHMQYTAADARSGSAGTLMLSNTGGFPAEGTEQPFTWPQGHYTEGRFRLSPATLTALPSDADIFTYFGYTSYNSNMYMEWDTYDFATGGCVNWEQPGSVGHYFCDGGTSWSTIDPNWTPTVYHTYGEETQSDGVANMKKCIYYDGTLYTPCFGPFSPVSAPQVYAGRDNWYFGLGDLINITNPRSPSTTMELWVKQITFWDCPNWQSAQCNTPVQ